MFWANRPSGRSSLRLTKLLILLLLLLSRRTPLIASDSALANTKKDEKTPKPGKRGLPAAAARSLVSQVVEKEGDDPRTPSVASIPAERSCRTSAPDPESRGRITAPGYLQVFETSCPNTCLSPPPSASATGFGFGGIALPQRLSI
jgi:hypothetical protein